MFANLDEDELARAAVFAVQVDDGVAGGAGACEVVEDGRLRYGPRHCFHRMLDGVY